MAPHRLWWHCGGCWLGPPEVAFTLVARALDSAQYRQEAASFSVIFTWRCEQASIWQTDELRSVGLSASSEPAAVTRHSTGAPTQPPPRSCYRPHFTSIRYRILVNDIVDKNVVGLAQWNKILKRHLVSHAPTSIAARYHHRHFLVWIIGFGYATGPLIP